MVSTLLWKKNGTFNLSLISLSKTKTSSLHWWIPDDGGKSSHLSRPLQHQLASTHPPKGIAPNGNGARLSICIGACLECGQLASALGVAEAMLRGVEMALPNLQTPFLPTGASPIASLRRVIREDFRPSEEARRETLTRSRYRSQATHPPKDPTK
jgi:hypothetical protein